jgi:hypothetical protein
VAGVAAFERVFEVEGQLIRRHSVVSGVNLVFT